MEKTTTYDPLRLLVKQNGNEKLAYNLGFDNGKEKAATEFNLELVNVHGWLTKRIITVEDIGEGGEGQFLRGMEPWQAYGAALNDVWKVLDRLIK